MKSFRFAMAGIATICLFHFAAAQKSNCAPADFQHNLDKPSKSYTPPDPWKGFPIGKLPKHLPEGMNQHGGWIHGDKPGFYSHWTAEAWTGSDEPFLTIRKSIDDQIKAGKKPMELLEKYRAEAQEEANIGDAKDQFAWAYAAFVAYQKDHAVKEISKGVAAAMERPKSPKSYQYTRMRAIFTHWDEHLRRLHTPFLRKVVLRLTKRNPKDFSLKYIFAYDFAGERETNPIAMRWAQEYRKAFPNKMAGLFLIARVYEAQFGLDWVVVGKKPIVSEARARKAIEQYELYLKMAPANDSYREHVKFRIQDIKRRVELFRRKGMLRA